VHPKSEVSEVVIGWTERICFWEFCNNIRDFGKCILCRRTVGCSCIMVEWRTGDTLDLGMMHVASAC
jgi:hypothetical protein